jgi:prenyltransferase beta subunit
MSLRLELLQVARLAPKLLGESADLVRDFLLGQQNADGGFRDRAGQSDLYYTVFALDGLIALQAELPGEATAQFLNRFGAGEGLDFVHLCSLARCWAALAEHRASVGLPPEWAGAMLDRLGRFRTADGGYHAVPGSMPGTAYGAFLALGAYQDLKASLPEPMKLATSLKALETEDGAWTNELAHPPTKASPRAPGSTNATAAAVTVLRQLGAPVRPSAADWLLARAHPQGGFRAAPEAPLPDLLTTATALHALAGLQVSFERLKEPCLDFIDSLWTNEGGFYGHWGDDTLDCEYTFYALLALGHLSL